MCRYSPAQRAQIGKYACENGIAAAARYFSKKLDGKLSVSTVQYIKKAYIISLRENRASQSDVELTVLPVLKRGRPLLLGDKLDAKLQLYLKKIREGGGGISTRIVVAAARGLLMSSNKTQLEEFGGHVRLNQHWAYSLLRRMKFVQRKATTSKSKYTPENFSAVKKSFLEDVVTTVDMEGIPPELIMNWDQTGIKLVPSSSWTMAQQGSRRVEMSGVGDKRQITAIYCGTILGDFLPLQLIYQGKTPRCHPHYKFPPEWSITHSPKHWSNEQTMLEYIDHIIVPYIERVRQELDECKPALVIMDNFKGQVTEKVISVLELHDIHTCLLPPNTTDVLQPMDISVNKPAKDFLRIKFQQWYSAQIVEQLEERGDDAVIEPISLAHSILKEVEAQWLMQIFEDFENNPQIIVNGFIRSGITGALDGEGLDTYAVSDDELEMETEYVYSSSESELEDI